MGLWDSICEQTSRFTNWLGFGSFYHPQSAPAQAAAAQPSNQNHQILARRSPVIPGSDLAKAQRGLPGGSILGKGGGNILAKGGGSILAKGGSGIVAAGAGGGLLSKGAGTMVAPGAGGGLLSKGAGTLVAPGAGGNLVSRAGGSASQIAAEAQPGNIGMGVLAGGSPLAALRPPG